MSAPEDWWAAASTGSAPSNRGTPSSHFSRPPRESPPYSSLDPFSTDPVLAGLRSSNNEDGTAHRQLASGSASTSNTHINQTLARGSRDKHCEGSLAAELPEKQIRSSFPKEFDHQSPPASGNSNQTFSPPSSPSYPRRVLHSSAHPAPVSRTVLREVVEHATGLGRNSADPTARDVALRLLRVGKVEPGDFFRAIVTGPSQVDAPFNIRVLALVHWIIVLGGPACLSAACEPASRRPSAGSKICLDVLRACGNVFHSTFVPKNQIERLRMWELDQPSLSHDTESISSAAVSKAGIRGNQVHVGMFKQAPPVTLTSSSSNSSHPLVVALEKYSLFLGRKLAFHAAFPEVEANYSLDRYYRQSHVETSVDSDGAILNLRRRGQVISHLMANECAVLANGAASVAAALDRAKVPVDIVGLVFADAINAYVLANYVRSKVSPVQLPPEESPQLEPVREWLARRLAAMESRAADSLRVLRRFVEPQVMRAVEMPGHRPVRPESRHRREIACVFTCFDSFHSALKPPLRLGILDN